MEAQLVLSFIGVSILLALMPGPDNIFVLLESLKNGSKTGILISVGLVLGVLGHTILAATGLSLIIQESAFVFDIIKYAGAAYLFYLAYLEFKDKSTIIELSSAETIKLNQSKLISKGFIMNILNPKVSLFFIAFFPQFVSTKGYDVPLQMVILGLLFMAITLSVFSTIALLAEKLSSYLKSPQFFRITKIIKIVTFCALGLTLALSAR